MCHQGDFEAEGVRADECIECPDARSASFERRPKLAVCRRGRRVEGSDLQRRRKIVQRRYVLFMLPALRCTEGKLRQGDRGDPDIARRVAFEPLLSGGALRGLLALRHEVLGKLAKTTNESVPSPLGGNDEHSVADPLQEHKVALEPEFARRPDALAPAITK